MSIVESVKLPPSPRVPAAGVTSKTSDEKVPGTSTEPYADRAPAVGGGTVVGKGIIVDGFGIHESPGTGIDDQAVPTPTVAVEEHHGGDTAGR